MEVDLPVCVVICDLEEAADALDADGAPLDDALADAVEEGVELDVLPLWCDVLGLTLFFFKVFFQLTK